MNGDAWRPLLTALLAMALTVLALATVVLLVQCFGRWGFWLAMSSAAVMPPWLHLRARLA